MRNWVRFASRLYPRKWRARYGEELRALLEDVEPKWTDVFDVVRGALTMQVKALWGFWKAALAIAAAGLIVGIGASMMAPKEYQSVAVLHATEQPDFPFAIRDQITYRRQDVMSRVNLASIIQRSDIDLYQDLRKRMPLEDVIERMKKDISIKMVGADNFSITFSYPDRQKAQLAVDALSEGFRKNGFSKEFELVQLANLPQSPSRPNRLVFAFAGWGVGLAAGIMTILLRRRRGWTLRVAGFGLAGAMIVAGGSLLLPNRYTSTAVLRVAPFNGTDRPTRLMSDSEMRDWLDKKQSAVTDDATLSELIHRPTLDLYRSDRESRGVGQAIAAMRRDLHIERISSSALRISFTYPGRLKAQATVNAIVAKLIDTNFQGSRVPGFQCLAKNGAEFRSCLDSLGRKKRTGDFLDLLDPANLPESPVGPNRMTIAIAGLVGGLLFGAYRNRRHSQPA